MNTEPFFHSKSEKPSMTPNPVESSIKQSLFKNGFPDKAVRLPFKPIYDCCKNNGIALKNVLRDLQEERIVGKIQGDFIEFRSPEKSVETGKETIASGPDFSALYNQSGIGGIGRLALDQIARMSPDQVADLLKMVERMSPDEKAGMLELINSLNKPKS